MARYPLWSVGQKGRSTHHSAQRRINLYGEVKPQGDRSQLAFYGTPGLELFADLGDTPIRGLHVVGSTLYAVHRGTLYSINNAGVATSEGTLDTTSGRVGMEDNGRDLVIVDGAEGYIYDTTSDAFNKITDADFPAANTVAYQGQRIIVDSDGTGRFYILSLGQNLDPTNCIDATEFATAESFPDQLVAVHVDGGQVILFGDESMEFWANVGATDFPYTRVDGAVVEWGLAARWSLAKFQNQLAFLAKNRMGEVQAMLLDGYTPRPISTPDEEYIWNGYSTVSDATALSYMTAGHPFYQINFPTAGTSWLFDGQTGLWSELQYGTTGERHRAEIGVQFLDKIIVSDYLNGRLYRMDPDVYSDNGVNVAREIISRHVFDEEHISVGRLWIDMAPGVGTSTGQGTNPQAMLSVSKDAGQTWGPERWRTIGPIGKYGTRAIWRRLGRAYDWTFKLRISDPVKVAISGAWIDTG